MAPQNGAYFVVKTFIFTSLNANNCFRNTVIFFTSSFNGRNEPKICFCQCLSKVSNVVPSGGSKSQHSISPVIDMKLERQITLQFTHFTRALQVIEFFGPSPRNRLGKRKTCQSVRDFLLSKPKRRSLRKKGGGEKSIFRLIGSWHAIFFLRVTAELFKCFQNWNRTFKPPI